MQGWQLRQTSFSFFTYLKTVFCIFLFIVLLCAKNLCGFTTKAICFHIIHLYRIVCFQKSTLAMPILVPTEECAFLWVVSASSVTALKTGLEKLAKQVNKRHWNSVFNCLIFGVENVIRKGWFEEMFWKVNRNCWSKLLGELEEITVGSWTVCPDRQK